MEDHLPRKLAAIFYADVAEYSRLTGEDEDATHRCLREYLDLIAKTIESHRGVVMHYAGDAVLAKFDAVIDSVASAVEVQQQIVGRNDSLDDARKLQFRIGLNLGDVIEDRGDIYGDGVNIAARLEALAQAGGICVSESIRSAIGTQLDLSYTDLGEQTVKNIAEPVRAFHVVKAGEVEYPGNISSDVKPISTDKPSIVVLPFKNMGGDDENDYFVDGITEEIMIGLCCFHEIVVVARGSSLLVDTQASESAEAASRLGAQYALDGSLRRAGDKIRITARLIEAESGHQIWSERYDRVIEDIFDLQEEVAQQIVGLLVGKIEHSDHERSMRKETGNLSAYECVLQGRYLLDDWHGEEKETMQARVMFERAIDLDPRYAAAYAGLSATYLMVYDRGWADNLEESGVQCIDYALKAIELDECDSYSHLILSYCYWQVKSDFELAHSQLETAISLNPNYYWNYCYGCWFNVCAGNLETSANYGNEAIRRNPLLPGGCLHNLAATEYLSERYANAIEIFRQITKPDPENIACLAACHAQLGNSGEASRAAEEFREQSGKSAMSPGEWQSYWDPFFKFQDPTSLDHIIEGLEKAGLVSR